MQSLPLSPPHAGQISHHLPSLSPPRFPRLLVPLAHHLAAVSSLRLLFPAWKAPTLDVSVTPYLISHRPP